MARATRPTRVDGNSSEAALAVNNLLLFLDKVILTEQGTFLGVEFALLRAGAAAIGFALLMYGLVWDAE